MFRQVRYQTGEAKSIKADMLEGKIPCVDVDDNEDLKMFLGLLEKVDLYEVEGYVRDKKARDPIKEPEFEFRTAFYNNPISYEQALRDNLTLMYIDFYFEPILDEDYAPISEIF